jgi:hypothetical protein
MQVVDHQRAVAAVIPNGILTPVILKRMVLPIHFQRISSLDMSWTMVRSDINHDGALHMDIEHWKEWWEVLLSMSNLRKLYLKLTTHIHISNLTEGDCDTINGPIKKMLTRNLQEFHIVAPEPLFRSFHRMRDSSCTFSFENWHGWGYSYSCRRFQDEDEANITWDLDWKRREHEGIYFPTQHWYSCAPDQNH